MPGRDFVPKCWTRNNAILPEEVLYCPLFSQHAVLTRKVLLFLLGWPRELAQKFIPVSFLHMFGLDASFAFGGRFIQFLLFLGNPFVLVWVFFGTPLDRYLILVQGFAYPYKLQKEKRRTIGSLWVFHPIRRILKINIPLTLINLMRTNIVYSIHPLSTLSQALVTPYHWH